MDLFQDLEAVADAAMAAHGVIDKHGTREMRALSRLLLLTIGKEIVRRQDHDENEAIHGDNITHPSIDI